MCQNPAKIAHCSKGGFFRKFYHSNFYLLTVPYHTAKYEKKSLEQIIGPKLPIWLKIKFWGETSVKWFLSTYFFFSCCKIWKKSLEWIRRYKLYNFGPQLGQNCPFCPKKDFLGNFTWMNFTNLRVPFHTAKFEKSTSGRSWGKSLHNFGPPLGWNCAFGLKEHFFQKFHGNNFYLLIVPYHAAKF